LGLGALSGSATLSRPLLRISISNKIARAGISTVSIILIALLLLFLFGGYGLGTVTTTGWRTASHHRCFPARNWETLIPNFSLLWGQVSEHGHQNFDGVGSGSRYGNLRNPLTIALSFI
jgi:hypothetical protein